MRTAIAPPIRTKLVGTALMLAALLAALLCTAAFADTAHAVNKSRITYSACSGARDASGAQIPAAVTAPYSKTNVYFCLQRSADNTAVAKYDLYVHWPTQAASESSHYSYTCSTKAFSPQGNAAGMTLNGGNGSYVCMRRAGGIAAGTMHYYWKVTTTKGSVGYYIPNSSTKKDSAPTLISSATKVNVVRRTGSINLPAPSAYTLKVGQTYTHPISKTSDSALSYRSSNTAVATVNASTGLVTARSAGTATITASIAQTGAYTGTSKSYTVTVVSNPAPNPPSNPSNPSNPGNGSTTGNNMTGGTTSNVKPGTTVIQAKSVKKVRSSKARRFSLRATTNSTAKLKYKSSSKKVKVSSKGRVTIARNFVGKAKITISCPAAKGFPKAKKVITITVKPKKASARKAKSTKAGTATISWKRETGATSYQVCVSTSKSKCTKTKKRKVKGYKTSYTCSGLKAGKKYYICVRACKKVSGRTYYGAWSTIRYCTTKKAPWTKAKYAKAANSSYSSVKSGLNSSYGYNYKLVDIDGNGIKELLCASEFDYKVYTFDKSKKKAKLLCEKTTPGTAGIPLYYSVKKKSVCLTMRMAGMYTFTIYKIKGSKAKKTAVYSRDHYGSNGAYSYNKNNKACSKSTYESAYNSTTKWSKVSTSATTSSSNITVSTGYFTLKLPSSWAGKWRCDYRYEPYSTSGAIGRADFSFYKNSDLMFGILVHRTAFRVYESYSRNLGSMNDNYYQVKFINNKLSSSEQDAIANSVSLKQNSWPTCKGINVETGTIR